MIKHGLKSSVTKLWNERLTAHEIARKLNIPVDDVIAFVGKRGGFETGTIAKRNTRIFAKREAYLTDDAKFTKYGVTPKPTLPKLKFMGDS